MYRRGVRREWKTRAGIPSDCAVHLHMVVGTKHGGKIQSSHNFRGVVGVPSEPWDDAEREHCISLLAHKAGISPSCVKLDSWKMIPGSYGVEVEHYEPFPVITEKDLLAPIKYTKSAPPDDTPVDFKQSDALYPKWRQEYRRNPYLRLQHRKELTQRWWDIQNNIFVLSNDGRVAISNNMDWYRLLQHVVDESLARGYPLFDSCNIHQDVPKNRRFSDGSLCAKAAAALRGERLPKGCLVKYGKRERMRELFKYGICRVAPASEYDVPRHNAAVRDKERELEFQGVGRNVHTDAFVSKACVESGNVPEDWFIQEEYEFVNMFNAGLRFFGRDHVALQSDNVITIALSMITDYMLFCMSKILHPSLFSDFNADACVIVDAVQFMRKIYLCMTRTMPNTQVFHGHVNYQDSLGAYGIPVTIDKSCESFPTQMVKTFKYAYQKEWRIAWTPKTPIDVLSPVTVEIGTLKGFAHLLELS